MKAKCLGESTTFTINVVLSFFMKHIHGPVSLEEVWR